jgi:hypothetical protein
MPLILARAKEVAEERAPKVIKGAKFWGAPGGDIRYICESLNYAVYVIEEKPGKRAIKWEHGRTSLWFPWIYFFIRIPRTLETCKWAPAYILISRERQETLKEKTLMVPYLPNLFNHGGICPNHEDPLTALSPMVLARKFVTWFWMSRGTRVFVDFMELPSNLKKFLIMDVHDAAPKMVRHWSKSSTRSVLKINFQKARYRSVIEAAHSLRFAYWGTNGSMGATNDMTCKVPKLRRTEIKSKERACP